MSTTVAAALLLTWGAQHAHGQPGKDGYNPHPVRPALWEVAGRPPDPVPSRADRLARQLKKTRDHVENVERVNRRLRKALAHKPDVNEAIGLASVVYNVPRGTLMSVAKCESGLRPTAENPTSTAGGLFQFLYWERTTLGAAGFSRHSPYAQALQAAQWIRTRGLSPWYASRHCWGTVRG